MRRREFVTGVASGAGGALAAGYAWNRSAGDRMPPDARISFSQQGEDIVLWHALKEVLKIANPTYMDVGAAHPTRSNNTYLLYWDMAHGVLVEPNPMFCDLLRRVRPRDVVVQAGIGAGGAAEADYYEIRGNPMLNTFSAEQVEGLKRGGQVVERVTKMPLLDINRVIEEHLGRAPDLLSTDVEGLDYAILQTVDFPRFRPAVICSEGVSMSASGGVSRIAEFLGTKGYVPRGGSMVNSIFIDAVRLRT